jgi:hypothetical protein
MWDECVVFGGVPEMPQMPMDMPAMVFPSPAMKCELAPELAPPREEAPEPMALEAFMAPAPPMAMAKAAPEPPMPHAPPMAMAKGAPVPKIMNLKQMAEPMEMRIQKEEEECEQDRIFNFGENLDIIHPIEDEVNTQTVIREYAHKVKPGRKSG